MLSEIVVGITDYLLGLECLLILQLLHRCVSEGSKKRWYLVFFLSIAVSSFAGGTVHAFFYSRSTWLARLLWKITLLGLGITALSMWYIAVGYIRSRVRALCVQWFAVLSWIAYSSLVFLKTNRFDLVLLNYFGPVLFLLVVIGLHVKRSKRRQGLYGVGALLLTLLAGLLQTSHVAVHPVYFNHNALYHLVQGAALWTFYLYARWDLNIRRL